MQSMVAPNTSSTFDLGRPEEPDMESIKSALFM